MTKIGRNAPCPCGSGRKYKRCCGRVRQTVPPAHDGATRPIPEEVLHAFREHERNELIRTQMQGHGRPMVSFESHDHRIVAVGNHIYWSKRWKTFHDFLFYYIKKTLGPEWGNRELAKPWKDRHPILQWYDELCRLMQDTGGASGKVKTGNMTGGVSAYVRLAYNLYLLAHNTKDDEFDESVQLRLIRRLKHHESFPGAYYEAEVFGALIKAGFEIAFEDESGRHGKRCEAVIRYKATGATFSVEAKAIRRKGALGAQHSTAASDKPLAESIRHQLYRALSKNAPHPRIIFIDVNLPVETKEDMPEWINEAVAAVDGSESLTNKGAPTDPAFVILTNRTDHHSLGSTNFRLDTVGAGYKIDDFGQGKRFDNLIAQYHAKQRHIEVHRVLESLVDHAEVPSTFDGQLPSVAFENAVPPVQVGERYIFAGENGEEIETTVTTATVNPSDKTAIIGTESGHIFQHELSDTQVAEYLHHGDSVFGLPNHKRRRADDIFELFEFMHRTYSKSPKERLLDFMANHPDAKELQLKSQEELALIYCQRAADSIEAQRLREKAKDASAG